MSDFVRLEIMGEAFRLMTGQMAPFKDPSPATYPAPFEEREKMYEAWVSQNREAINAMLRAVEHVMDKLK